MAAPKITISGPQGCGKTELANVILRHLAATGEHTIRLFDESSERPTRVVRGRPDLDWIDIRCVQEESA